MSTSDARRYVLLLWLGMIGLQVANQVTSAWQQGKSPAQFVQTPAMPVGTVTTDYLVKPNKMLGAAIVFTLLFGLAELTPPLAVALAASVDLLALFGPLVAANTGTTVFDRITALVKASAA